MKRWAAGFLVFILILSGCKTAAEPENIAAEESRAEVLPHETQTIPESTDSRLPEGRTEIGNGQGLWEIPNRAVEESRRPELRQMGQEIVVYSYEDIRMDGCTCRIQILDLPSGSKKAEAAFPCSGFVTLQSDGTKLGICDSGTGSVRILNSQLQTEQEVSLTASGDIWYLGADLQTVYEVFWDSGITAVPLSSGSPFSVLDGARYVYVRGESDQKLALSYTDLACQRIHSTYLDLKTGEMETLPVEKEVNRAEHGGQLWLMQDSGDCTIYVLSSGNGPLRTVCSEDTLSVSGADGRILALDAQARGIKLYDADGTFCCGCELPEENWYFFGSPVWDAARAGYWMIALEDDENAHLLFWEAAAGTAYAPPLAVWEEAVPEGNAVEASLYERAEELSERFGIKIRIADRCSLDYSHYTAQETDDSGWISDALSELERALAAYPSGFLEQLLYGNIRNIQIELTGGISKKEEAAEAGEAAAFTQECTERILMVADVYQISERIVYHEISHMIDRRLEWDAGLRPEALFDENAWMALQPDGFSYAYSYTEMPESVLAYVDCGWFMNGYACTFPTEDRATMMETAMCGETYEFDVRPGLRTKLEYFSRCIRDCFDTAGWPEVTAWEQVLQ